jgi:hypothetical protein
VALGSLSPAYVGLLVRGLAGWLGVDRHGSPLLLALNPNIYIYIHIHHSIIPSFLHSSFFILHSSRLFYKTARLQRIRENILKSLTTNTCRMAPVATTLVGESEGNAKAGALGMTTSGKKLKIRSYPKFNSLEEERLYRKQHLAAAFRV